ncbi:MAG: carbamoyltransferase HypF, partial [Bacillota bacterium]
VYSYALKQTENKLVICMENLIKEIAQDVLYGKNAGIISGGFHMTMVAVIVDLCSILRNKYGLKDVVLSGGVFQNRLLLELSIKELEKNKFTVHFHSKVPANDGGIALGQAAIALRKYINGEINEGGN